MGYEKMINDKTLAGAIAAADENALIALANKGLYKRALKDVETLTADYCESDGAIDINVGSEKCRIVLPLSESKCSCPSRTICRHILAAVILLKNEVGDITPETAPPEPPAPEPKPDPKPKSKPAKKSNEEPPIQELTASEKTKIHECAEMCAELLGTVIMHGLTRVSESAPDDFELAAVRCHAEKMAEAERLMREIGSRLADCAARRAAFDSKFFTQRLIECTQLMEKLMSDGVKAEDLGTFRQTYEEYDGNLEILPVGQRNIAGGDYEGEIYYFVNTDKTASRQFFTFSDIRPTFYETRRKVPPAVAWGLQVPVKQMMHTKMTLAHAKVRDGKLSASKETEVIARSKANLNCSAMWELVLENFTEAAVSLAEREIKNESDQLFLIRPARVVESHFDKLTQNLIMTLEDCAGNVVQASAKYRRETKDFIAQLELLADKMLKQNDGSYTMLVSAYIDDGVMKFFPIEIYDFIEPPDPREFEMPQKYESAYAYADCIQQLRQLFSQLRKYMEYTVRTGLQSADDAEELSAQCEKFGMQGLCELVKQTDKAVSGYRHSTDENRFAVLEKMARLYEYLEIADKKIGVLSALSVM